MQIDRISQHFATGYVTAVQQKWNHRRDTDIGCYNGYDFIQSEQMCQK